MAIELQLASPQKVSSATTISLGQRRRGMSSRDRKFFTEQLALLLETGSSLVAALDLMVEQSASPAVTESLEGVVAGVRDGASLADALAAYPESFPPTYATLIRAAENGGYLERALKHLLAMEENREELRSTLVSAFTYPAFLITFSLAVVIFILVVVFPKFATLFASIADELPASTKILMAASELIAGNIIALIVGAIAAIAAGCWALTRPGATAAIHDIADRIPGLKSVLQQFYLIQTMRTLSLSLANGVTLVDALEACRGLVSSPKFDTFLSEVGKQVTEGKGFSAGFSSGDFVPVLAQQMIATGDEAGRLELVTGRLADHYQVLLERRLNLLSKIIEPAMLLVMGLVVGIIVSSLILPIFKISRAVH